MVKGMLAFGIFITHGLACYVAIDITWNDYVTKRLGDSPNKLLWEYVVRTLLVLVTCKYFDELIHVLIESQMTKEMFYLSYFSLTRRCHSKLGTLHFVIRCILSVSAWPCLSSPHRIVYLLEAYQRLR